MRTPQEGWNPMKPVLERVLEAITPRSQSSSTLSGHDQLTLLLYWTVTIQLLQNIQNGSCNVIHEPLVWAWLSWWLFKWYKMVIDILQETLTITKVSTNNMVGSPCVSYFSTHSNRIPDRKKINRGRVYFGSQFEGTQSTMVNEVVQSLSVGV